LRYITPSLKRTHIGGRHSSNDHDDFVKHVRDQFVIPPRPLSMEFQWLQNAEDAGTNTLEALADAVAVITEAVS